MAAVNEYTYQRQWQAYRRRRTIVLALMIGTFLGFFPFGVLVATIEQRLFHSDKFFFPAMVVYGVAFVLTGAELRRFPCPRCGKNFFGPVYGRQKNPRGRNCESCGLRRFEGQ